MKNLIEKLAPILKPYDIHPEDFIQECIEEVISSNSYGRREVDYLPCIEALEESPEENLGEQIEEAMEKL